MVTIKYFYYIDTQSCKSYQSNLILKCSKQILCDLKHYFIKYYSKYLPQVSTKIYIKNNIYIKKKINKIKKKKKKKKKIWVCINMLSDFELIQICIIVIMLAKYSTKKKWADIIFSPWTS